LEQAKRGAFLGEVGHDRSVPFAGQGGHELVELLRLARAQDERDAAIVQSLVDLGRRLGLRVVAEGVETKEARDLLVRWGCDEAQGHLVGRPMPAGELVEWLRRHAQPVVPDAPV